MSAYYSTMMDSSNAAKQLATNAKGAEVNTTGLIVATKASTAAMIGARIAATALQMAISFGLSLAIQFVVSKFQEWTSETENQKKAAQERAKAASDAVNEINEETKSIEELIDRYKKLKSSDNVDIESRKEIKNIQEEITKLVNTQANHLDLVNGKLDEELEKLKKITKEKAKQDLHTYRAAASTAMDESYEEHDQDVEASKASNSYDIYADVSQFDRTQIQEILKIFAEAANNSGEKEYRKQNIVSDDDDIYYYWLKGANVQGDIHYSDVRKNIGISTDYIHSDQLLKALDEALNYIVDNIDEPNNSDLYTKLAIYRDGLVNYINERQNKLSDYLVRDIIAEQNTDSNVASYDEYINLRGNIIQGLLNDTTIQEGIEKGFIDDEWVENQVDNYLSTLDNFSNYYSQWYDNFGSETAKGIKQIKEQYKDSDVSEEINNWIDGLSKDDKDLVVKIFNSGTYDTSKWGIADWKNELANQKKFIVSDAKEIKNVFDGLMQEKGTDKNPSFVENIEKSVEQFQKLEDALVKFESGTLTDKEKTSLFKAFPQLTAYADNLGAGIRNLLGGMRGDVVSQFTKKINEFKKAGATDEEIAQLEAYKRTILNIADSVDSVKNALDSMKSVFKDLDSVIKDYNENQYFSLESLEKLGQNGQRYLSYLSYENGQLKINEEAYKKLVLAQIDEIETKATLQATTDLQSLTDETAAKEYLAKVNIDLAQSQLTAAQAAFQYQLALKLAQGGSVAKAAQKVADNLNSLRNIFASARSQVDDYAAAMLGATSATEKKAKASEKAKSALESEQRALEHSKKALEDEKKTLEDTKSEYEKAQKAIEDLIKWTQNYIKQIKEDEVKALQDKKEKFDELIEKQKEALQAEKDLHDYEKSVGEKQNDLASNALKVSVSSLDDSGAGKKAYKQAQEEYKKSQTDMEDFLYDHSIETREKALDQLKEDTDKSYDEQIKTIQDYLSNEVQLYRDACSMIDNDNGDLYGKLLNYCLTYTTTGKNEFDRMWSLAQTAMEKYNVASIGTMQFMDELKGCIYDVDDAIDAVSKNIETYENRISDVKTQLDNLKDAAVNARNALNTTVPEMAKRYTYSATYKGMTYSQDFDGDTEENRAIFALQALRYLANNGKGMSKNDVWSFINEIKSSLTSNKLSSKFKIEGDIKHYASGTRSAKSGIAQINENGLETLMRKTPDGDFVIMNQDDQVYTKKQTDNLYDFASDPEKFLSEKGLSPLSQEELANLGLWGDSSQLGMINSAFGVGGLSGLIEKITGGSGVTSSSATTNNIAPVVNITIQGDATQSTVNALHAEAESIIQRARSAAHNDFIETVLKGRKWR